MRTRESRVTGPFFISLTAHHTSLCVDMSGEETDKVREGRIRHHHSLPFYDQCLSGGVKLNTDFKKEKV